jgi:integrase
MRGTIIRRGKQSWRLKFDAGRDPLTGKRDTRYLTVRGTRRNAESELARVLHELETGALVEASRITVAEFLDRWLKEHVAHAVSPKTAERYGELARMHVIPHLGAARLQKLKAVHFVELYGKLLREGRADHTGLAPRTVGHVHRLMHRALGHAVKWGLLAINPAASADPPPVASAELEILTEDQVREALRRLRGRAIYPLVAVALATGMRRGELLALRWKDIDLDSAKLRVEQSLEQTKASLRFKSPKTKHGRRSISLAPYIVAELRAHWKAQQEQRLALGLGKAPDDALVFANWDGAPRRPDSVTKEWARATKALALPRVSLHALRHTHASQLIASGMDVLTVSRRLGHGSPTITLGVYGHLFSNTDDRAAQVMQAAFGKALTE